MADQLLVAGPWKGVRDTSDPYDDPADPGWLQDAQNCYVADTSGLSGLYARPGATLANSGTQLGSGSRVGHGIVNNIDISGTKYVFAFTGNGSASAMYRVAASLAATDVTPTGVAIANNVVPRFVYGATIGGTLVITDGVNKPWVCSNLSSTPVTGTYIELYTPVTLLQRGVPDTSVANIAFNFQYRQSGGGGTYGTQAAFGASNTALPAGTIPINQWGIYLVELNNTPAVTITAGAANYTTGYATEAAAIAALPARSNTRWYMGYFTVCTLGGTTFVANTDALAGGATGNVASATNYYVGEGPPWCAFGKPVVYKGSLFFILDTANTTPMRNTIVWSEPNQPTVGYYQVNYADWWTLVQQGTAPLFCLHATNSTLFYSRELSWGAISGTPSTNFSTTATQDAIAVNVGCTAPATVHGFGDYVFFCDNLGRPWRFRQGEEPEPLWSQARTLVETNTTVAYAANASASIPYTTWGVIEPNLNLYIACTAISSVTSLFSPYEAYVFDAQSGRYYGRWQLSSRIRLEAGGIAYDAFGLPTLLIQGGNAGTTNVGYLWQMCRLYENIWTDNGAVPVITAKTQRLGYSANMVMTASDVGTLITQGQSPVTVTVQTPYTSSTTECTAKAVNSSSDATYRVPFGMDVFAARGIQITVSPTTASSQWVLQQVQVPATMSLAGVEEQ